jgi:hypothetical protein
VSKLVRGALAAPIVAATVLGTVVAQADVAAASTVVALWHMNETSGTTMVDSSGHHNNGALHNVTLGGGGFSGKAYSFNGTSSYVSVPSSASLNPGSANITISFYLSTTSLPKSGDYDLVRKGAYPAQNYKVELLPSGQIMCTFQGSPEQRGLASHPVHQDRLPDQDGDRRHGESDHQRDGGIYLQHFRRVSRGSPGKRLVQGQARRGLDHHRLTACSRCRTRVSCGFNRTRGDS